MVSAAIINGPQPQLQAFYQSTPDQLQVVEWMSSQSNWKLGPVVPTGDKKIDVGAAEASRAML